MEATALLSVLGDGHREAVNIRDILEGSARIDRADVKPDYTPGLVVVGVVVGKVHPGRIASGHSQPDRFITRQQEVFLRARILYGLADKVKNLTCRIHRAAPPLSNQT